MEDSLISSELTEQAEDTTKEVSDAPEVYQPTLGDTDPFKDYRDDKGLIKGKYKEAPDLIQAYENAQKKISEGTPKAPNSVDEYDLQFQSEEFKALDWKADGDIQSFLKFAHAKQLPNALVSEIVEWRLSELKADAPDMEAERQKLGDKAEALINNANTFVGKLAKSQEELDLLKFMGSSATGINLMKRITDMMKDKIVPNDISATPDTKTADELRSEAFKVRQEKFFSTDPAMQDKYQSLLQQAAKLQHGS